MVEVIIERNQAFTTGNQETIKSHTHHSYENSQVYSYAERIDPDLLIKEYFTSTPTQRTKNRKNLAKHISSVESVLEILKIGASREVRESYDGSVALLAEINNDELFQIVVLIVKKQYAIASKEINARRFLDDWLAILLKSIACSSKIKPEEKYRLIQALIPVSSRRVVKAAIIDSLNILADQLELSSIKNAIEEFTSDEDQYISKYAEEALQDLS